MEIHLILIILGLLVGAIYKFIIIKINFIWIFYFTSILIVGSFSSVVAASQSLWKKSFKKRNHFIKKRRKVMNFSWSRVKKNRKIFPRSFGRNVWLKELQFNKTKPVYPWIWWRYSSIVFQGMTCLHTSPIVPSLQSNFAVDPNQRQQNCQ